MTKEEAARRCDNINRRMAEKSRRGDDELPYPSWFYRRQLCTEFRAPGTSWYCVNAPEKLAGQLVTVLGYPYITPGYHPHYDVLDAEWRPAPSWGRDIKLADGTVVRAYAGGLWDHIPW